MARESDSRDTAASAAVNNCGWNACLERRRAWVVMGFIELVMERESYRSLVLCDLVLYTRPELGAVDGV